MAPKNFRFDVLNLTSRYAANVVEVSLSHQHILARTKDNKVTLSKSTLGVATEINNVDSIRKGFIHLL